MLYQIAVVKLQIRPDEFWGMTFGEFGALHEAYFGEVKTGDKMTRDELAALEGAWVNGST